MKITVTMTKQEVIEAMQFYFEAREIDGKISNIKCLGIVDTAQPNDFTFEIIK